ncbi:MAG: aminopeptidase P family protein [Hydrogenibacillus schlegelii]|nr:aminopeptidase P family protein [Hydrogenibacillus schlegelii]
MTEHPEKNERLIRLQERLRAEGLSALVVTHGPNRRYLTGFTGSAGLVVVLQDRAVLITDFRYEEQALAEAIGVQVDIAAGGGYWDRAAEHLKAAGARRIGFEAEHLSVAHFRLLSEAAPGEWVPASGLVEALRAVKEAGEIERIRAACRLADLGVTYALEIARPGMTERELALELESFLRRQGAEGIAFPTIVASGERGSLPHGTASDRPIGDGELVTLDFGIVVEGYVSDITRTFAVGRPPERLVEVYEVVRRAQEAALQAVRPGVLAREVDRAARAAIEAAGYGPYFGHSTGHGIGLEVHEKPALSSRSEEALRPGMVVTVEPGIYLPGLGGVRIEDDVLVTEAGAEVLTLATKALVVVG